MTGWGILATGWIAEQFVGDLKRHGHSVVAVGSRTQASADEFAARFDIPRAHSSYEDLVADPDVDIVYIATPHPYHLDNATLALNAGKHVLIEKLIVDHTQDLPDDPTHRINALELGGGALLDLGIYPISFAGDLFGKPETITRIEVDAVWYEPTSFRVIGSDGSVLKTYESAVVGRGMQFQAQEAERLS